MHALVLWYLWVWFNEHLTWHRHIREVVTKGTSLLWSLSRSVGTNWALQCNFFLWLVHKVALPSLYHRAPFWASVVSVGAELEELDRVLPMALCMAFGLDRFTLTEGLLVLSELSLAHVHIL